MDLSCVKSLHECPLHGTSYSFMGDRGQGSAVLIEYHCGCVILFVTGNKKHEKKKG
jgi:hypothetical protein